MMSIMDFVERFVAAHERQATAMERQAAASEKIAEYTAHPVSTGFIDYGRSDGTECTAGQPAGEPAGAQKPADWDPLSSSIQKKYGADKQQILDRELAKLGLDPGLKMTGAQKHQLLLDKAAEKSAAPVEAPAVLAAPIGELVQGTLPGAPAAPAMAPAAAPPAKTYEMQVLDDVTNQPVVVVFHAGLADNEIGMNQLRAALNVICQPGGEAPMKAAGIIKQISGASRLTDNATGKRLIADEAIVPIFRALMDAIEGRA